MRDSADKGPEKTEREPVLGERIAMADWTKARNAVSDPNKTNGRVFQPRPDHDYTGKLMFITDTHLVMQVGGHTAVIHDLKLLDQGAELAKQYDEGKLRPRATISVRYGPERGEAEVIPFSKQMAEEVMAKGQHWAEQHITNARSRDTFMKHFGEFTAELSKGIQLPSKANGATAPKNPERTREMARA